VSVILQAEEIKKVVQVKGQSKTSSYILQNIDLQLKQGEFLTVMGPSGSGKSTLLYTVSGMDSATAGKVYFQEKELTALSEKELAKLRLQKMGFIFQHIHLLKNLSVFDNIVLAGYMAKKMSREEVRKRATTLMEQVGIESIKDNMITEASGGQLQRVAICRALINSPELLFGDEPTGALNSKATNDIMEILGHINASGTSIMLVTHDSKVAARSERVLFMMDGQIVAEKMLGKYDEKRSELALREQELHQWLVEHGF